MKVLNQENKKTFRKPDLFLIFVLTVLIVTNQLVVPLNSYFSQDDFYHLRQIMDKKVADLPIFFLPAITSEQTFYRPLSREIYNFITFSLFGLSPLPYHLIILLFIFIIGLLMFKLILVFSKSNQAAIVGTALYYLSAIHSTELYYTASVENLITTLFSLLTIIFYLYFFNNKKKRYYFLSLGSYLFTVGSHESSIVLLPMLITIHFFWIKQIYKIRLNKLIMIFLPFVLVTIYRIFIFLAIMHLPKQIEYQADFNPKVMLNSFIWLVLWIFNLPEFLVDFVTFSFKINPNLIKWYGSYLIIVIPLIIVQLTIVIISVIQLKGRLLRYKDLLFFISLFLLAIAPLTIFPSHKFSYYLSQSSVWIYAAVGSLFAHLTAYKPKFRIFSYLFIIAFSITSIQTVNINALTHWAAKRDVAAEFLIKDIKSKYPTVVKGTIFYIVNNPQYPVISPEWGSSSKQAFYILSGADAFKLIYHDNSIRTYFEDVTGLPEDIDLDKIIVYQPLFPY
ncbi:MAG: hypothetical protein Q7R49_04325 [Candidatus Daviesbacteria bacterium]|nr:hypothetical protein [Candidatus Daviesbacteria bacterium]